jgi:hypothetical protein
MFGWKNEESDREDCQDAEVLISKKKSK